MRCSRRYSPKTTSLVIQVLFIRITHWQERHCESSPEVLTAKVAGGDVRCGCDCSQLQLSRSSAGSFCVLQVQFGLIAPVVCVAAQGMSQKPPRGDSHRHGDVCLAVPFLLLRTLPCRSPSSHCTSSCTYTRIAIRPRASHSGGGRVLGSGGPKAKSQYGEGNGQ